MYNQSITDLQLYTTNPTHITAMLIFLPSIEVLLYLSNVFLKFINYILIFFHVLHSVIIIKINSNNLHNLHKNASNCHVNAGNFQ